MSSFIISDLHFGHENLCRNLRGMSAEENDALLIQRWNNVVNKRDKVWILGDITLDKPELIKRIIPQLHGFKEVILGNHDTPRCVKALIECGYVMPVFSVQSFTQRNLELMGVDYTSVLETVEFMIQSGKEVRLNSVYTNQGIEEFCQIIDYCIEKGIRRYSIGVYIDINSQNENVKTNSFKDVRILDEKLQLYIVNKYGENKLV